MELVNEDIVFDCNNGFAHSEWLKLFGEEEQLHHSIVKDWCDKFELQRIYFEYDDEDYDKLYTAENPLDIWPLEMSLDEGVLLGYYDTEDGYIQVWAVGKEEE